MTPANAELIFWAVACVLALVFIFIVMPIVSNYLDHKDTKRMFSHYERTEYHDDMEDWNYFQSSRRGVYGRMRPPPGKEFQSCLKPKANLK